MDFKPITMSFPDTLDVRNALRRLAWYASTSRPDPGGTYGLVEREIARVLAFDPEPVDAPLHDGGGDQP